MLWKETNINWSQKIYDVMNPKEDFGVVDLHGLCKWGARYMFQSYLNKINKGLY